MFFHILTLEDGTDTLSQNIGNQSTYAVQQTRRGKDRNCIAVQARSLATCRVLCVVIWRLLFSRSSQLLLLVLFFPILK